MTVALSIRTAALTHPALLATLPTPPVTPSTPVKAHPVQPLAPPVVDYALLRSHHAYALRYVIAKLRWEQANNGYIRGEDAWLKHNKMIQKLEAELKDCEAAQAGLNSFPNCFAPVAFPKPHGPLSQAQLEAEKKKAAEKEKELDAKLDAQFPFIKQLFIGPMTKQQARNDRRLRDQLLEGDWEDLEILLPPENLLMLEGGGKAPAAPAGPKLTYEQRRMEKEKANIAKLHEGAGRAEAGKAPKKVAPAAAARIGPLTEEEWRATLPVAGPKTKGQAMLPEQREQRHAILTFLRKPWPEYDEEAAGLMEKMGKMAVRRLNAEVREAKEAKASAEKAKEKERGDEVPKAETKDGGKGEAKEGN